MMLTSPGCSKSTVVAVARKILAEMQALSSNKQDSMLCCLEMIVLSFSPLGVVNHYAFNFLRCTPTKLQL